MFYIIGDFGEKGLKAISDLLFSRRAGNRRITVQAALPGSIILNRRITVLATLPLDYFPNRRITVQTAFPLIIIPYRRITV